MKRRINAIILTIAGLVIIGVATFSYLNTKKQIMTGTLNWKGGDPQKLALRTNETGIFHVDFTIKGDVKTDAPFSILVTDSLIHKEYNLKTGNVDLKYQGDWRAAKLYLIFTPPAASEGTLDVRADFVGH
jgi:hypothetical protein